MIINLKIKGNKKYFNERKMRNKGDEKKKEGKNTCNIKRKRKRKIRGDVIYRVISGYVHETKGLKRRLPILYRQFKKAKITTKIMWKFENIMSMKIAAKHRNCDGINVAKFQI